MSQNPENYRLSPRARDDLEEIWLYSYKTWSVQQADTYHNLIVSAFERIAGGSTSGQNIDYVKKDYFRYAVGSHYIFYRVVDGQLI